jgi:hypothetical protein
MPPVAGGAREVRLPDWPFGAVGRRLLLEALLRDPQPEKGWTKTALERRGRVERGGLDGVLAGALQLGLVRRDGDRWRRTDPLPDIATPLAALLDHVQALPDEPIAPLPKRGYRQRGRR